MISSVSPSWAMYQGFAKGGISKSTVPVGGSVAYRSHFHVKMSFLGSFGTSIWQLKVGFNDPFKKMTLLPSIKCENSDKGESSFEHVSVERPPYHSYLDSTSGELEPTLGDRASIPGQEYWPEGTASRVRAARALEPTGVSSGSPSHGQMPGSRRKKHKKTSVSSSENVETSSVSDDPVEVEPTHNVHEDLQEPSSETFHNVHEEPQEPSSEYVVYQTEPQEENLSEYEKDKQVGRSHPFIDPKAKKPIEEPLSSEELWWNWKKPEKEQWSRWQRRRPDVETVFLKAMAETGQVKLYGEHPTLTETSLYRARRHIYKEERLRAEHKRLESIGPLAYYSEWVKSWKGDTSREAVQKHFEQTGEDENTQLILMFMHQTAGEYRIMKGTDIRICRDPLAMRMREDQIKQIWGGDPVYPTINYIQDPDEVIDYRGPDFHEPTPNILDYLKEHGKIISREELETILAKEKPEELEMTDIDEAMARAVDIGDNEDEGEQSEMEADDGDEEKILRNWSVLKSNQQLQKSKDKPKKNNMSLDEAVADSENLTDFLMDFEEDE